MLNKLSPYIGKLVLAHLTVGDSYIYVGQFSLKRSRTAFNTFNAVVEIINLSPSADFFIYRIGNYADVVFKHIGLNRVAVAGSFVY